MVRAHVAHCYTSSSTKVAERTASTPGRGGARTTGAGARAGAGTGAVIGAGAVAVAGAGAWLGLATFVATDGCVSFEDTCAVLSSTTRAFYSITHMHMRSIQSTTHLHLL